MVREKDEVLLLVHRQRLAHPAARPAAAEAPNALSSAHNGGCFFPCAKPQEAAVGGWKLVCFRQPLVASLVFCFCDLEPRVFVPPNQRAGSKSPS